MRRVGGDIDLLGLRLSLAAVKLVQIEADGCCFGVAFTEEW